MSNQLLIAFLLGLTGAAFTASIPSRNNDGPRIVRRPLAPIDDFGMFHAEWTADLSTRQISFLVVAETLGYVGFGFSSDGMMVGSDIVIGGVYDDDGRSYFADRHGTGYSDPPLDVRQNYDLHLVMQNATHTTLGFSRLFDTGDADHDLVIRDENTTVIWAIGSTDSVEFHRGDRGQYLTNLLQP